MDKPKCKLCGQRHYGVCAAAYDDEPVAPTKLQPHHMAWLTDRPKRSVEWLKRQLADGFHIHHIDGDHSNNSPENLILIEGGDHVRLHRKVFPVLRNTGKPFDRNSYQRELMRKRRAAAKAASATTGRAELGKQTP